MTVFLILFLVTGQVMRVDSPTFASRAECETAAEWVAIGAAQAGVIPAPAKEFACVSEDELDAILGRGKGKAI